MKFDIKKLPKAELELEIEVPEKEFDIFYKKAVLELGKDLEIEGFRKGKAPENIIIEKIGKEKILMEAAEMAIKENYKKVVLDNNIEAISQPEISIIKIPEITDSGPTADQKKLVFKAKVVVLPEVKLPDYKKIAAGKRRNKILVESGEVEESLKWLLKSRAKFSLKNSPAEAGDFVEIRYWSKEIPEINRPEGQRDAFILKEGGLIPGFEDNLIGMKNNEEKEFSLDLPLDYIDKNLAGKKVLFKVKMDLVQKVEIPEANDEFVRSLGKFSSLDDLKKSIEEGINMEKERAESQRIRSEIIKDISEKTEVEIPEILIKKQQELLVHDFKHKIEDGLKISFEQYMEKIKKTEKEIIDSFYEEAKKRAKEFLVLREIGKQEKIEVKENEIKEEADKILRHYRNINEAERDFEVEKLKEYVKEIIRNEKIFAMLEKLVK
jgi:trigger factor